MEVSRSQFAGGLVAVVLVAVIATALVVLGSPGEERTRRLDERRILDLENLSGSIDLYWTRHGNLPTSLAQIQQEQGASFDTGDPETGAPYEYRPLADRSFELCAQFQADSQESTPLLENGFWSHRAGYQCFRRDAQTVK